MHPFTHLDALSHVRVRLSSGTCARVCARVRILLCPVRAVRAVPRACCVCYCGMQPFFEGSTITYDGKIDMIVGWEDVGKAMQG